jgi:hypothetical protein
MEIWKDVVGYEKIYEVSNLGRVRTHAEKTTKTKKHGIRKWKQRVLKQKGKHESGGFRVCLWKDGNYKTMLVHRLVASSFLGLELNSKMTVDHIDGNRENNNVKNLRVVTLSENIKLGMFEQGLYTKNFKSIKITKNGKVESFMSFAECERKLGISKGALSVNIKKNKLIFNSMGNNYEVLEVDFFKENNEII